MTGKSLKIKKKKIFYKKSNKKLIKTNENELDRIQANKICLMIQKILINGIFNISKFDENKIYVDNIRNIIDNHIFSNCFKERFDVKNTDSPVNNKNVKKIISFYCTNLSKIQMKTLKNYLELFI